MTLLRFTVIRGLEEEGTFSNALHVTRPYRHFTSFVDMFDPGMKEGNIPKHHLSKNIKAIILTNVFFPAHTEVVKKIINQDKLKIPVPGKVDLQEINMPAIIICTSSAKEKIPFDIFPGGKVGFLDCGFDAKII